MSSREQSEQRRCRVWLETNGHGHRDAFLSRMGATDWVMEEVLMMVAQGGKQQDGRGKVVFSSGASSSKIPRFDLIPGDALVKVANRFELGIERHQERAWNAASSQACLLDDDFVIARAAHVIDHAWKLIQKLRGQRSDDGDDDAAAIAWGGICLSEAMDARFKAQAPKERRSDEVKATDK